jgi:hypothetical protein
MLITALFPNADTGYCKSLRKLADEKKTNWFDKQISVHLHNLMYSILRHNATHYDECIGVVGQEKARFYIQGEITRKMRHFKGGE